MTTILKKHKLTKFSKIPFPEEVQINYSLLHEDKIMYNGSHLNISITYSGREHDAKELIEICELYYYKSENNILLTKDDFISIPKKFKSLFPLNIMISQDNRIPSYNYICQFGYSNYYNITFDLHGFYPEENKRIK